MGLSFEEILSARWRVKTLLKAKCKSNRPIVIVNNILNLNPSMTHIKLPHNTFTSLNSLFSELN